MSPFLDRIIIERRAQFILLVLRLVGWRQKKSSIRAFHLPDHRRQSGIPCP